MSDTDRPAETPTFETDTVQADRAREQGLGLGERELQAQRDPGGVRTADVDESVADDDSDGSAAEGVVASDDEENYGGSRTDRP